MKTIKGMIGVAAIAAGCFMTSNGQAMAKSYKVVSVTDGDTIRVQDGRNKVYVRLIGVDAPELSSRANTKKGCYAVQSKNYLTRRLLGKYVDLRRDFLSGDKDVYGRLLRYVYLGREEINLSLVLNGYAREYRFYANDYVRRPGYTIAQNTAKIFRRGLWNLRTCSMNR